MSSSLYCIRYYRLFAVYFIKKIFCLNIFYFEINFTIKWLPLVLLLSLVSNNLTNNGRRHSRLLTNCHVSFKENLKIVLDLWNNFGISSETWLVLALVACLICALKLFHWFYSIEFKIFTNVSEIIHVWIKSS